MRHVSRFATLLVLGLVALGAARAPGQGIPTATLAGHVTNEGTGLPGVTVTARSASLQGSRVAVTGSSGSFALPNLPPGEYTVTFELSGFARESRALRLGASQSVVSDVAMRLEGVKSEAVVTATSGEVLSTSGTASTTYTGDLLRKLPTSRNVDAAVNLAPGVNANGPNSEWSIAGAMSYENLWTINGAVVQDNIRAGAYDLFIEDAVQETTIQTSGISAEFGRFQGGVVNAITKSGGNAFSGSLRVGFRNDDWSARTPAKEGKTDEVVPRWEATLGGPIWKDRIWFFGAGRLEDAKGSAQTAYTNVTYPTGRDEKRFEGKLTVTPFANHTLTGSYLGIRTHETGNAFRPPLDLSLLDDRDLPQSFVVANWSGVLTSSLFAEAQYSRRTFTFEGSGADARDLIRGTPIFDSLRFPAAYNSPFFCGVCDPEERNNEDVFVKGTWFVSTPRFGSHTISLGYDSYAGKMRQNNYQSGSDYVVFATTTLLRPDAVYPVFDPGTAIVWYPIADLSRGTDMRTNSAFLNDQWRLGERLSFNVGLRWDQNANRDSLGAKVADDTYLSPRLSATWAARRDGSLQVRATYARYVAALAETIANSASSAGTPSLLYWYYDGPGATPINAGSGPLVPTADALRALFAWFQSKGCPGVDCQVPLGGADLPGVNTVIRGTLRSPHTEEVTVGGGGALGTRLSWRADLVHRTYRDFYATLTNTTTGRVTDALGNVYDLGIVENTNEYVRRYDGLQMQFAARPLARLSVGGNWTWSRTRGNVNGENAGSGPLAGDVTQYPEYRNASWYAPVGDLGVDQRHRVRLYASWDAPLPSRFGSVTLGAIQQVDTGTPYGALGSAFTSRYVTNPGYVNPPRSRSYWFTNRDAFRTDTLWRTDLSLQYALRLGPIELFAQPQVLNAFNAHGVVAVGTGVLDATNDPTKARFNPFTETPVRGVNWDTASSFGKPSRAEDYQLPRTFRVSLGLRF